MPDVLFILVLALVIFGPKKLPEVMRQVAKFMAQFRMMRDDLKRQIEGEMLKIELEERDRKGCTPPASVPVCGRRSQRPKTPRRRMKGTCRVRRVRRGSNSPLKHGGHGDFIKNLVSDFAESLNLGCGFPVSP